MKRIVETTDGGFEAMLGEAIELWCGVYIYAGKLVGVNDDHVELDPAWVVYETGNLDSENYANAQKVSGCRRVMKASIESWGPGRCV